MPKNLIIVESPAKARTISKLVGNNFIVDSSMGHIRDLPKSKLGIDVEHNFEPHYIIPRKASSTVKRLRKEVKKAESVILASDEDREGEAIAWHLTKALDLPDGKIHRIVFHEITKKAIEEALANPRTIDMKRVDAQQARRILDRLVGYSLSPFLWKKVYRGLSAGRVQSVAVRLIVEREREIEKFKPEEYHTISAVLQKLETPNPTSRIPNEFAAHLIKIGDTTLGKFDIKTTADARKIVDELERCAWRVENVEKRATTKNPPPPFTTSTLQQEAFRRIGFSAKQTMMFAQQLYEGVDLGDGSTGLITYMRTDSTTLSEESLAHARGYIQKEFGAAYTLDTPRRFKTTSKGAQEAHEAIRPTDPARTPESIKKFLDAKQYKLYDLIWRRFIATQMPQAIFDATTIDIAAAAKETYIFRATGQIMKFDGFLRIYPAQFKEVTLPDLVPEEKLTLIELKPEQHFTEPPPRFTEASLVKILEKNGIGRPSTYAPIISTIQDRRYVEKHDRRYLKPTDIGFLVNDLLVQHFPQIVDIDFTAKMEEEFDEVATGKKQWQPVIKEFYEPFAKNLETKKAEVGKQVEDEITNEVCEKCGKPMIIKHGRFGRFIACSGFPNCRNTKKIETPPVAIGMKCPKENEGDVIIKKTRRGKIFFGCSRYPDCDWASWTDPRNPEKKEK